MGKKNEKKRLVNEITINQSNIQGSATAHAGEGDINTPIDDKANRIQLQGLSQANDSATGEVSARNESNRSQHIFIGHGRSPEWTKLKDFIVDRLNLTYDEFERESTAGLSTKERHLELLNTCYFAFLVMTAEDEQINGTVRARENVIHEIGLFQGRYGFKRAIVLREESCNEFSNIKGIMEIQFPRGNIEACFEKVRRVLEREKILNP